MVLSAIKMYRYRIFFVCGITSVCRLKISVSGSRFSLSIIKWMVAKSRILDPISVIAFIFLISTTIVEFMTLLHSKKGTSRAFLWEHGGILVTYSCQSRAFNRKHLTYMFENLVDKHSRIPGIYYQNKWINK